MGFVILLLAYGLRRWLDSAIHEGSDLKFRQLLARWPAVKAGREGQARGGFVLWVLVTLLVGAVDLSLRQSSWWALTWPLDFAVLVVFMGVPGWRNPLRAYGEAWRRGDAQAAWHHVNHLLAVQDRGLSTEPTQLHRLLTRQLIAVVFERYFLLIFWYAFAGPAGVVGARLAVALRDHWPHPAARPAYARLVFVLAWIPARLVSISFGIAGDLAGWLANRRGRVIACRADAAALLFDSANGALSSYSLDPERFARTHPDEWPDYGERSLRAVRDLLNRSMFVWICGLALLAIIGIFT